MPTDRKETRDDRRLSVRKLMWSIVFGIMGGALGGWALSLVLVRITNG